jgi:SAM-dependent methyltransferase
MSTEVTVNSLDWSTISVAPDFKMNGFVALSETAQINGILDIENQIGDAEDPHIGAFYRQFYIPMLQIAGIDLSQIRILELGAGFGKLAYGTFKNVNPELYVATDVFTELVNSLTMNLPRWTQNKTGAAILNPDDKLLFKPGVFNVIQSHSVLHHILDYKKSVKDLYNRLDTPGVLIFAEPCMEGYLMLITAIRMFRQNRSLPAKLEEQLDKLDSFIVERCGPQRNDLEFLSQYGTGDKYIYSLHDLMELAAYIGARLHIERDYRDLKSNIKLELSIRGADEETLSALDKFLDTVLPPGINNGYFSDMRQIFCFIKK